MNYPIKLIKSMLKPLIKTLYRKLSGKEITSLKIALTKNLIVCRHDWVNHYRNFLFERAGLSQLRQKLIHGLDQESIQVIDLFIGRVIYILSSKLSLIEDFYSEKEKLEQLEVNKVMNIVKQRYRLPIDHYEHVVFYYKCGLRILEDMGINIKTVLKDNIIVDGWGYIGDSLIIFLEYDPKIVICFEPNKKIKELFIKTVKMNKISPDKYLLIQYGLSDSIKKSIFYLRGSGSGVYEHNQKDIIGNDECELVTLDYIFKHELQEFRNKVKLIKLDIEGQEFEAIKGGINLIQENRPILLISIYHRFEDFFYIKPYLEEHLLDYKFLVRKLNPYDPIYETMLIAIPKEMII